MGWHEGDSNVEIHLQEVIKWNRESDEMREKERIPNQKSTNVLQKKDWEGEDI